jgi:hypothetical protein
MLRTGQNTSGSLDSLAKKSTQTGFLVSAGWALAALAIFLLWQFLTVHYNRGGNWNALFLTGKVFPIPPDLAPGTYTFPGKGYDGEMYRYVAHDVLRTRGYARYLDIAAERYHRILVPALAYLLVAGYQPWIDKSYIAVVGFFAWLGAYWLSRWAVLAGAHPGWALAFLAVPATLISMDRMTVDIALAALTIGFAVYLRNAPAWKLFVVLVLACLVRETGLLLVGGVWLFDLIQRRFARVALWSCAALPMLAWYAFIRGIYFEKTHLGAPKWFARKFGAGLFYRMFRPQHYPLPPVLDTLARAGDVLALAGILLGAILAIVLFLRARPKNALVLSALLFTALVFVLTNARYWNDVNGYARVLSPLLILVALPSIARQPRSFPLWLGLAPTLLVTVRLGIEFSSAIGGVLRGLI